LFCPVGACCGGEHPRLPQLKLAIWSVSKKSTKTNYEGRVEDEQR
jgi:hypothetical protein